MYFMVEIFRTHIDTESKTNFILEHFQAAFPHRKINFNLEGCDDILGVETRNWGINENAISALVMDLGHEIEIVSNMVANTMSL